MYKTVVERLNNHYLANKRWRENNRERYLEINRLNAKSWRESNSNRIKEIKRASYQRNRDKYLEKSRLWRMNNPEKVKEFNKKYYGKYKELKNQPRCKRCTALSEKEICDWCIEDIKLYDTNNNK